MMKIYRILIGLCGLCSQPVWGQSVQAISGVVRDIASGRPLAYVTVVLSGDLPERNTTTDSVGRFLLPDVPVGRYNVHVSCVGYEPAQIRELLHLSAKETRLEVALTENLLLLHEVVVTPKVNKAQPLNSHVLAGGRLLSVEEAGRYAGGFDDPARLAAAFAGVGNSMGNNGMIVRGNAPHFFQWRLEEVEIPNPNHFAEITGLGGGGLTALSNQVLGNSDFFSGAFPAEYGNALSGVFDIRLRNGNSHRREHTVQAGLIGVDVASEGPFRRGQSASYLFNYRYSTLSLLAPLLPADADGTRYQDLAFKLYFPARKAGIFSVWGIGLADRSGAAAETDTARWVYEQDKQTQDVVQYMAAAGVGHKINAGRDAFLTTTLAATLSGLDRRTELWRGALPPTPENAIENRHATWVWASAYNRKWDARHSSRTGLRLTGLHYRLSTESAAAGAAPLLPSVDEAGSASLLETYSHSTVRLAARWTLSAGLHLQWLTLNGRRSVEPRLALRWQAADGHALAFAGGLHSRMEPLNYYFLRDADGATANQNLDFTRALHTTLAYDLTMGDDWHLKAEPYLQLLYGVPVAPRSTFSLINLHSYDDGLTTGTLTNEGRGRNYGIDLTLEKYMSAGYYLMLTASLFSSRYTVDGTRWFPTRYDRSAIVNLLVGKEWIWGDDRRHLLGVNLRLTGQGGDRSTPVDEAASALLQQPVYDTQRPYAHRRPAAFPVHFTVSYRLNTQRYAHEIAIKVLNATGYKDFYGHRYNFKIGAVEEEREAIVVPNISYKIAF
jgi:hypothetical protein